MLCAKVAVSAALLACLPSVSPLHADALDEFLLARDALAGRSYAEAVVLLARFREEHPQSALSSEAAILRARAYRLWGKRDDAVKSLVDFIDNDPEDPWATRARLLLAEVFLEAARFEDASEIYRLRLEALRGDAYLLGLSSYYLEIADPAFVGRRVQDPSSALPKEIVQHDFATALEFYRKARAIHIPAGRRGEVSFRIARCLLELRQDAESVAEFRYLLARSKSQTPPPKLAGTLEGDAIFSLATGLYRTGDPKGAIAEFLRLEKEHADHRWVPEALERVGKIRLEIVDATSAETERRVRFREALLTWNRFLTRYPQHDLAPRVEFQRAAALARFGDVDAAVKAYSEFPVRYEKDSQAPLAILRVAELERARNAFDAAIEAWKRFLGTYPNDSRWSTAQTRIKQARYDKGAHLLSVEKKPADARVVWGRFLDEYPLDSLAPEVYRRFYEMALPANAMPPDRGPAVTDETLRRQYLQAISHLRTLFGKYPRSPQAPSSRLITAQLIHHRLDDLEGSIIEYEAVVESFPGTLEARQAAETLTSLRRRHLKITTPRAFTTDGPWRLEIETRNVARLRFKAYRLNLEEYFRHKHAVASIEDVVVGVVEPTKTWESDLAGYRPFRLLGGLRELPLDDKELGAFIVTIEDIPPVTKIDAGPAEPTRISGPPLIATTLLLRSNIAFVTKHSTSGTLTWVFDERSGAPVRDARVLLSTSGGVVAEGKTDDEGIWRHDRTEASSVGDARIMAIVEAHGDERGSHYAVDRVVARGASAYGYSTKVHVSTDRPLYRPSQTVHFRAVLRKAVEGRYESSEGEKATILVRNPLGVVLFEETLTANEFGSIAGKLELTEEPPLGDYRVNVRYRKLDFAGSFAVEEYRKPEFAVRLATDRASYLPGEAIEGSIVTEYLFGAPVVGAQVSYSVFEGPFEFDRSRFEEFRWFFQKREVEDRSIEDFTFIARGSGKTDARGRTPFRIEARDAGAGRTYRVVVEATDLSKITVGGGGSVIVSPQGVLVVARADRKVYRPGDKATVSFRTVDATAAPIDASGDLVLLRRRRGTKGASLDEEVRSQPFETRNGLGETSLTIDKPGEYRVLFRTEDRAGTVCEGGAILLVAGDEPDLRKEARLLAGKAVYRQGEEATLYLNTPVGGRHALLTFEGAGVIDYRVIKVEGKSHEIVAPMKSEYSPNIHVAIALPADNKLYEARDEIIVLQFLNVSVTPSSSVLAPGEEVELEVTATDQGGLPVEAELSLAVVDRSIFELSPDVTEAIKPYFYDQRRRRGVSTGSSYSFGYAGVTRVVEAEVLEEYYARQKVKESETDRSRGRDRIRLAKPGSVAPPTEKSAIALGGGAAGAFRARRGEALGKKSTSRLGSSSAAGKTANEALGLNLDQNRFAMDAAKSDQALGELSNSPSAALDGTYFSTPDALRAQDERSTGGRGALGRKALAVPKIRRRFADTAYWNPNVRTDADGRARVKLKLPDNLTSWQVATRGSTRGTLFGEAETSFRTSKKLLVRLQTPRFLTREDRTTVTSPVHNYLDSAQKVRVRMTSKGVDVKSFRESTVTVGAGEARGVDWELAPPPAADGTPSSGILTLEALTAEESDAIEHVIPVLPFGKRHAGGDGGLLVDRILYDYELPGNVVPGAVSVDVDVYPHQADALLDTVYHLRYFPYGCVEQTVSGFLPAIAVREALDRLGTPREDLRRMLDELIPKRIVRLLNLQRPSGGWGWWGRQSASSSAEMTAIALIALERCRVTGYRVQADRLELGRKRATQLLGQEGDTDLQALLAYALSFSKRASVDALNRLNRYRDRLSGYALALTVLAEKGRGNHGAAAELAGILSSRTRELTEIDLARKGLQHPPRVIATRAPTHPSSIESTAYALLALEAVEPGGATNRLLADALLSLRRGVHWGTTKASAAAVTALATHFGARGANIDAKVDILVDGKLVETVQLSPKGDARPNTARVVIPITALHEGRNRIELRRRGSGDLAYAIRHEHYTSAERIEEEGNLLRISRRYESFRPPKPAQADPIARPRPDPRRDTRDLLTGYTDPTKIAGDNAQWLVVDTAPQPGHRAIVSRHRPKTESRAVRRAERGGKIRVRLHISAREDLDYVQIEDPIPAGCEVVNDRDDRFTGAFERKEVRDRRVVFFLTRLSKGTHTITYLLRPTFPGSYRALPALAQCMYEPTIAGTSADHPLEILEKLADPEPDPTGLTIDERLYEAERAVRRLGGARGKPEEIAALRELYTGLARVEHLEGRYRDLVIARLVAIDLAVGRHREAIEGLEELRRRNPRLIAGNGDLLSITSAYRSAGEFEQVVTYQKRIFDAFYLRDRRVGETLFKLDEQLRAQTYGLNLAASYPDSSRVITDTFELSRRYASLRMERSVTRGRLQRTHHEVLYKDAAESLARFVSHFPTSKLAPQAQYLVIDSLERLNAPELVVEEASKLRERYPDSQYLDDALYAALRAEYSRKRYDAVIEKSKALASKSFRQPNRRQGPSEHYPSARYLAAKAHHILGNLPAAVKAYTEVRSSFPDAADALGHLTAKELRTPDVVSIALEKTPKLEINWKNLDRIDVKIYRVDLPLLFAVRKDLKAISAIDLTGIDPVKKLEVKLDGAPHAEHRTLVDLPAKEKGVYLVSSRAGGRETSTIVIRSDLRLDVQRVNAKVRVHVEPRGPARIKISDGARIVGKGDSDARGIFEATVSGGRASILAERDGHFALYTE